MVMGYGIQVWDSGSGLVFDSSKNYCFVRVFKSDVQFKKVDVQTYRCDDQRLNLSSSDNYLKVRAGDYLIYAATIISTHIVEVKISTSEDDLNLNLSVYRC